MARDAGAVEGRRVALRALLAAGDASSSAPPRAEEPATRPPSKGLLRGLRCTSAAASQAFEPEAVARPSAADWRGLGCTSVAGVHAPADAAADWRGRRRRRGNRERRKARGGGGDAAGMGGDVWCTPGIPFHAEASSVDCVVGPHQSTVSTRRRAQAERSHRERPGAPAVRRITMREHMSSSPIHSPPHHNMPLIDADGVPSGRNRHLSGRGHSRIRVEEEMMMFRTRLLLGRLGMYDQYQDWRLDVDNMTYEELLDLEDRMGYVSTGLCEDEILRSLRMVKHTPFNTKHFSTEMDRRCSICQEEFEAGEEIGKLSCGHNYHVHCIKQWLSRKNSCPVCKTAVSKA
ncbi:hypothetical protein QOZ80_5AG0364380 [Eleusine coracana subsp. coracana]|nr:hypothetical protein QOZ80_5AG0364380 [Eleusine coracana subsp. coracana]